MYSGGPSSPACATPGRPSRRACAKTRANLEGGLPTSAESRPTAVRWWANGRASSSVCSASSSLRSRRKHRIRPDEIPNRALPSSRARLIPVQQVSKETPRPVCVCGSKKISAWRTPWLAAFVR